MTPVRTEADTAWPAALSMAEEHAARRWALARRVGYLEGVINSTISALEAGIEGDVVARGLRDYMADPKAPQ